MKKYETMRDFTEAMLAESAISLESGMKTPYPFKPPFLVAVNKGTLKLRIEAADYTNDKNKILLIIRIAISAANDEQIKNQPFEPEVEIPTNKITNC